MRLRRLETELWPRRATAAWRVAGDRVELTVTELGAHIVEVDLVDGAGDRARISVDSPRRSAPRPGEDPGYHGATVGRWANRIEGARIDVDGVVHALAANEGPNQLHGGPDGFNRRWWRGDAESRGEVAEVRLELVSPDGDQGYPGRVEASARFCLDDSRLTIEYSAVADRPTPVNLTSHVYWNLGDDGTLGDHRLTLAADRYVAVDDAKIPTSGPPHDVTGTRFDARSGVDLAELVGRWGVGYDHCFVPTPGAAGPHVVLAHHSGRGIEVTSDQPGVQVYTGDHLPADRRAVAIEPQRLPDAMNRPDLGPAIVRPGDVYRSRTTIDFVS